MSRISKQRRDGGADQVFGSFRPNPPRNRKALNERMYIRILTELSLARFEWQGLPETVDKRFLELQLFRQALVVFYKHPRHDRFGVGRAAATGRPNMYDNPTSFSIIGEPNEAPIRLAGNRCVPIWSNMLRFPDSDVVYLYATKLAEIDRTIEINLLSARNTVIIFADENERLSYENVMRQIEEGQPVIKAAPQLDLSKIQSVDLQQHPDKIVKLQMLKHMFWNECMTLMGINNANQDKRERQTDDEVGANDDQVVSMREVALKQRREAARQITRMFPDLRVTVEWSQSVESAADGAQRSMAAPGSQGLPSIGSGEGDA